MYNEVPRTFVPFCTFHLLFYMHLCLKPSDGHGGLRVCIPVQPSDGPGLASQCGQTLAQGPPEFPVGNLSISAGRASGALEPLQNLASSAPDGFPVLRSLSAGNSPGLRQAKLGKAWSSKIDLREGHQAKLIPDQFCLTKARRFPALRSTGSKHREPVRGTGS